MASPGHGEGQDVEFGDAISEVSLTDVAPREGVREPVQARPELRPVDDTTPNRPADSPTVGGQREGNAQPGEANRPDLTTPAGLGAVRDVVQQALDHAAGGEQRSQSHETVQGGTTSVTTGSSGPVPLRVSGSSQAGLQGPSTVGAPNQLTGYSSLLQQLPVQDGQQYAQQAPPGYGAGSASGTHTMSAQPPAWAPSQMQTMAGRTGQSQIRPNLPLLHGGPVPPGFQQAPPQMQRGVPGQALPMQPANGLRRQPSDAGAAPLLPTSTSGTGTQPAAPPPQQPSGSRGVQFMAPDFTSAGQVGQGYGEPSLQFQQNQNQAYPSQPKMGQHLPSYNDYHGYGGQAAMQQPPRSARTPMTAIASYGGYSLNDAPGTPGFGFGNPFFQPVNWSQATQQQQAWQDPMRAGTQTPATVAGMAPNGGSPYSDSDQGSNLHAYGMPSSIKNAVRMIQPFYSDGVTVEKAKSFWNAFERATVGLNDNIRLSAFRECLKGKTGENWWMYSQIDDFETLRRRFYNQFICQTPLQMIERLKNTKRAKGMSAEVWGDQVSSLCDAAQCTNPQMRYQYFLAGLRNKEWKTALTTTIVNTIPQAVMVLLYKNMHIPVEDDAEFAEDVAQKPAADNALMTRMMDMMQQTQNLLAQQQQIMARAPRSPRSRSSDASFTAPVYEEQELYVSAVAENERNAYGSGRRMGPDSYTHDGVSVCGRCHLKGCSRETCRFNNMTCGNCRLRGHVAFECEQPRQQNNGGYGGGRQQSSGGGYQGRQQNPGGFNGGLRQSSSGGSGNQSRGGRCFFCDQTGHRLAECPVKKTMLQLANRSTSEMTPTSETAPAQN